MKETTKTLHIMSPKSKSTFIIGSNCMVFNCLNREFAFKAAETQQDYFKQSGLYPYCVLSTNLVDSEYFDMLFGNAVGIFTVLGSGTFVLVSLIRYDA